MLEIACGNHPTAQPASTPDVHTHQLLLAVLGAAQHDGRRRAVARELLAAARHRGDYTGSVEELTPIHHDWRVCHPAVDGGSRHPRGTAHLDVVLLGERQQLCHHAPRLVGDLLTCLITRHRSPCTLRAAHTPPPFSRVTSAGVHRLRRHDHAGERIRRESPHQLILTDRNSGAYRRRGLFTVPSRQIAGATMARTPIRASCATPLAACLGGQGACRSLTRREGSSCDRRREPDESERQTPRRQLSGCTLHVLHRAPRRRPDYRADGSAVEACSTALVAWRCGRCKGWRDHPRCGDHREIVKTCGSDSPGGLPSLR